MIEQNQIADKKRWVDVKHKSDALGFTAVASSITCWMRTSHSPVVPPCGRVDFVDGDVGFADVRHCALHVGAAMLPKPLICSPRARRIGGFLAGRATPASGFRRVEVVEAH